MALHCTRFRTLRNRGGGSSPRTGSTFDSTAAATRSSSSSEWGRPSTCRPDRQALAQPDRDRDRRAVELAERHRAGEQGGADAAALAADRHLFGLDRRRQDRRGGGEDRVEPGHRGGEGAGEEAAVALGAQVGLGAERVAGLDPRPHLGRVEVALALEPGGVGGGDLAAWTIRWIAIARARGRGGRRSTTSAPASRERRDRGLDRLGDRLLGEVEQLGREAEAQPGDLGARRRGRRAARRSRRAAAPRRRRRGPAGRPRRGSRRAARPRRRGRGRGWGGCRRRRRAPPGRGSSRWCRCRPPPSAIPPRPPPPARSWSRRSAGSGPRGCGSRPYVGCGRRSRRRTRWCCPCRSRSRPAARSRSTTVASASGWRTQSAPPAVVGIPATSTMSLTQIGIPARGRARDRGCAVAALVGDRRARRVDRVRPRPPRPAPLRGRGGGRRSGSG